MTNQAANLAREKAAIKHKIAAYIADHYAMTREALCQADIIAALNLPKSTVNRAVRELQHEAKIKCVGLAGDTDRDDVAPNVRVYGTMDAVMLARSFTKAVVPRQAPRQYVGKPGPVREARAKSKPYRGECGEKYVPEFREMTEGAYDLRAHQKLALLAR